MNAFQLVGPFVGRRSHSEHSCTIGVRIQFDNYTKDKGGFLDEEVVEIFCALKANDGARDLEMNDLVSVSGYLKGRRWVKGDKSGVNISLAAHAVQAISESGGYNQLPAEDDDIPF